MPGIDAEPPVNTTPDDKTSHNQDRGQPDALKRIILQLVAQSPLPKPGATKCGAIT